MAEKSARIRTWSEVISGVWAVTLRTFILIIRRVTLRASINSTISYPMVRSRGLDKRNPIKQHWSVIVNPSVIVWQRMIIEKRTEKEIRCGSSCNILRSPKNTQSFPLLVFLDDAERLNIDGLFINTISIHLFGTLPRFNPLVRPQCLNVVNLGVTSFVNKLTIIPPVG